MTTIQVKLDSGAYLPQKAHETDAGYDIRAREAFTVPAGGSAVHDTGVHIAIPKGYGGLLVSKSGLNVKHGLTGTGLIDSAYTGPIVVKLDNADLGRDYPFDSGDKIIQLVLIKISEDETLEVVSELDETGRGNNGFGSTGR